MSQVLSTFVGPHALLRKEVFTVVCENSNPRIPPRIEHNPDSVIFDPFDMCWVSDKLPFMMLVLRHKPFYYPLFDRLDFDDGRFPAYRHGPGEWSLDPKLVTEWVALERNMQVLVHAMSDLSTGWLPKFFRFWPFPKRYGYELSYSCRIHVQIIAAQSRNAFVPLMATITLMFLILAHRESLIDRFNWREKVLERTGIHPEWLAALESSAAGDPFLSRVGGVIHVEGCEFLNLLPLVRKARMPLYVCWGEITNTPFRPHRALLDAHLVPDRVTITQLHAIASSHQRAPSTILYASSNTSSFTSSSHLATPSPLPSQLTSSSRDTMSRQPSQVTFHSIERFSGQHEGEHWQSFFARRQDANGQKAQHEAPQQKQSRLQREVHAAAQAVPGRKGARVYTWEDVDGFRVRRAVARARYESIWDDYRTKQRRYDAFRDEWDLCSEFDPSDAPIDSDDEFDFGDHDNGDPPSTLLPEEPLPNHNDEDHSSFADLRRVHTMQSDEGVIPFTDMLDDKAYYRFGFTNPTAPINTPAEIPTWATACEFLGNGHQRDTPPLNTADPLPTVQHLICVFLGHMLTSQTRRVSDMPMVLYDLRQSDADVQTWSLRNQIRARNFNGKQYYIISPVNGGAAQWEIGLTTAATVIEVLHRGLLDMTAIGYYLLDKGISFHTLICGHPCLPSPPKFVPRYKGLGF
jgi:hypothetical protein